MLQPLSQRSRPAFTIIEVVVAVSLLAILSTLVVTNLSSTQSRARDSQRKSAVHTYLGALEAYHVATASYFVTDHAVSASNYNNQTSSCHWDPANPSTINQVGIMTGSDCTGANGLSYGKMNLAGNAATDMGRTYTSVSIAQALKDRGYLGSVSFDPQAGRTVTASSRDYVLVRCCNGGLQNVSTGGSYIGIWADLEGLVSSSESNAAGQFCGGVLPAGQSTYVYDFAGESTDFQGSGHRFAEGNGPVNSLQSMAPSTCPTVAEAAPSQTLDKVSAN